MRLSGETPFPSSAVNPATDLLLSALCIKLSKQTNALHAQAPLSSLLVCAAQHLLPI
jgi:hypothetical protein